MNINIVKQELTSKINHKVIVSVYGLRNRITRYEGEIYRIYPKIFTILTNEGEKSFPYCDLITGEVKIKYL